MIESAALRTAERIASQLRSRLKADVSAAKLAASAAAAAASSEDTRRLVSEGQPVARTDGTWEFIQP